MPSSPILSGVPVLSPELSPLAPGYPGTPGEHAGGFCLTPYDAHPASPASSPDPAPAARNESSWLRMVTDPADRMNAVQRDLQGLMAAMQDGRLSSDEKLARLLNVQLSAQEALMHWELVSKTVEMSTSGVNTLARTQT